MRRPDRPLSDGTKILVYDKPLGSTEKMPVNRRHLVSRRPNSEGVAWGLVPMLNDDVYWVKHGNDKIMAVYGYWEFELA